MVQVYGDLMPSLSAEELSEIATPIDFLGVNSYFPQYVRAVPIGPGSEWGTAALSPEELARMGFEITEMGWPVIPDAFRDLLVDVQRTYNPPAMYVTENGAACPDQLVDGVVHDPRRVNYLATHIGAVASAIEDGAPLRGYFVWSLLDNFEWAHGYHMRFGIVYVDYSTQQRIVKDSGDWYRRLVRVAREVRSR
jgi:beta-glucosidase